MFFDNFVPKMEPMAGALITSIGKYPRTKSSFRLDNSVALRSSFEDSDMLLKLRLNAS